MKELFKESSVVNIVARDIQENTLNHAYMLISGDEEYSKALSKHIAKLIMCVSHSACDMCNQCIKIDKNEHADLVVLPSTKKNIVVDDIENIVSESYVLPLEGDKKIYILNNFDMATVQAQNKLLKTLEEPPKSVVFIITATNENNVLATIRSRCKKLFIPQINDKSLTNYLKRNYPNRNDIDRIVSFVEGNLTSSIKFLSNDNMIKMKDLSLDIINVFDKSDKVLHYSTLIQEVDNLESFLNLLIDSFREVSEAIVNGDKTCYNIAKYNHNMIFEISKVIQTSIMKFKANCNASAIIDYLLLGILEVRYKCQK